MTKDGIAATILVCLTLAPPASADSPSTFSLIRDSALDPTMRIHVATFDTREGEAYNLENCNLVAVLMQQQPGVTTRFWCERGAFRS